MVGNLVDNAVRAAAEGPRRPGVGRGGGLLGDGADLQVAVTDSGDGLSAETASAVFADGLTTRVEDRRPTAWGWRWPGRRRGGTAVTSRCSRRPDATHGAVFVATLRGVLEAPRDRGARMTLRVVVVDDDFRVAQLHAQFVAAVPGFEVAGGGARRRAEPGAWSRRCAPTWCCSTCTCPTSWAWTLAPRLTCDVIMVTAASDAGSVRRALARGRINYLVKPFTLPELRDRLTRLRPLPAAAGRAPAACGQADIDRAVRTLREGDLRDGTVPKGRPRQTARLVVDCLRAARGAADGDRHRRRSWGCPGRPRSATWPTWPRPGGSRSPCATARPAAPSTGTPGAGDR